MIACCMHLAISMPRCSCFHPSVLCASMASTACLQAQQQQQQDTF
jgi:hypothetical protein